MYHFSASAYRFSENEPSASSFAAGTRKRDFGNRSRNAAIESVVSIRTATPGGDCAALAVVSRGEYGVPEGLQFGYPIRSNGSAWDVIQGFELDDFAKAKIKVTTDELLAERADVKGLIS